MLRPIKTKQWAKRNGFTHHGRLHGIPVWTTEPEDSYDTPMICAKNWLFDIALDIGEAVFGACVLIGWCEPYYPILIGKKL